MKRLPSNVNIDTRLVANFRLLVKTFLKSGSLDTEGSAEIQQTPQQDEAVVKVGQWPFPAVLRNLKEKMPGFQYSMLIHPVTKSLRGGIWMTANSSG